MNGQTKKNIYIITIILIVILILHNLKYIVLIGIVAYIVMKVVGFVKTMKQKKDSNKFDPSNGDNNADSYKDSADDYINGEVIDVEYEEIDKNKQ